VANKIGVIAPDPRVAVPPPGFRTSSSSGRSAHHPSLRPAAPEPDNILLGEFLLPQVLSFVDDDEPNIREESSDCMEECGRRYYKPKEVRYQEH
jgi:hypothetical protein